MTIIETPMAGEHAPPPRSSPAIPLLLLIILIAPVARADGEPPRLSVSVFNVVYDSPSDSFELTLCPRWINGTATADGFAVTHDGVTFSIPTEDVPFRPGWLWPDIGGTDNCISNLTISASQSVMDFAISATSGGSVVATSCNVTIEPIDTFGNIGGTAYMCGSPQYSPDIRLAGSGEASGNTTTFRLNHSLHIMNGTTYQYQYLSGAFDFWSNIEPTSSGTINGGNLTQAPSLNGYRLANFTFTDLDPQTVIQWRVRATDTFTQETSPYSCIIALAAATDSFTKTCYARRSSAVDAVGPTWPMVNLTNMGHGLGVSALAAGGILVGILAASLAGIALLATRSPGAATGAVALAFGGGWIYNITPGWVLVLSFYAGSLIILARIMPGGNE